MQWKPLKGMVFGKLTVLEDIRDKYHMCKCECSCPEHTIKIIRACHLMSGATVDCGCGEQERRAKGSTYHGMRHTRFYNIWIKMKDRCYNPNSPEYVNYGGRGIIVCDRWRDSFEAFRDDMYVKYEQHVLDYGEKNTSIDRYPDNDGNYCPENCRWATREEQNWNKRGVNSYKFMGSLYNTKELAELFGEVNVEKLRRRLCRRNYDVEYVYNKWYANGKEDI